MISIGFQIIFREKHCIVLTNVGGVKGNVGGVKGNVDCLLQALITFTSRKLKRPPGI